MKFGIMCTAGHNLCNGGVKFQVYLFKQLTLMGHECHFFLENSSRCSWVNTDGIFYHDLSDVFNHTGDVIISNWHMTSLFLEDDRIKRQWTKRVLVIHDTPTANNVKKCLQGTFKIMGVSGTVLSIATGLHNVQDRVLPLYVNCGANNQIYNKDNHVYVNSDKIILGMVGSDNKHRAAGEWFRGIETAIEISNSLKSMNSSIDYILFTADTEEEMASYYKRCHFILELPLLAGCPTIVVEAMACGTPVITTYHGTQHIVYHEYNGLVLPKLNSKYCISYLLEKLSAETYEFLSNNIDVEKFSWQYCADNFIKNLEYY